MGVSPPPPPDGAIDAAISRVLEAEREAREAVARCREEGAEIVRQARLRAKRIAERAEARLAVLRSRQIRDAEQKLAALEAEANGLSAGPAADEHALSRLHAAVASLAAELSGDAG